MKKAGIIGIVLPILTIALPWIDCLLCTPSEYFAYAIYGITFLLLSYIHMLECFGISLFLIGKRNTEIYGKILIASGILWILASFGYIFGNIDIMLSSIVWMAYYISFVVGSLAYLAIPAAMLTIVHGAKFKDRHLNLAGVFYIASWLAVLIGQLLSLPPI